MNRKYKLLSWVGIAVAVAIFVLANIFMSVLTDRFPLKIDLTSNKRYELTDEGYEYLKSYDTDTKIYILASEAEQDTNSRAIIDRYRAANSHIKIENVDIAKNPSFGREYVSDGETLEENSVIIAAGDRFRVIEGSDFYAIEDGSITGLNVESEITSALKYVSSDKTLKVYFTVGHGEADFKGAKEALQTENYEVVELETLTTQIPEDASLVIIAQPTQDLTTAETAMIDEYLYAGGSVQLYVSADSGELPNLNSYITSNGISMKESEIVESQDSTISSQGSYMFLMNYTKNDVTSDIISEKRVSGYLPFARALEKSAANGAFTVTSYLTSTDSSYTSTDFERPTKDTAESTGAADIALMSENSDTGAKLYVCGTPMLLTYSAEDINNTGLANISYFTTVSNYMADAGDTFVVPVKTVGANKIVMSTTAKAVMFAWIVILIPGLLLAAGIIVFFRRRNM